MTLLTFSFILISIALSVTAQILLKIGMSHSNVPEYIQNNWISVTQAIVTNGYILLGLTAYGLSAGVWLMVLAKVDVSRAYPFVGLGFIATMVVANLALAEPITLSKFIGTMLIFSGVTLIAR